MPTPNDFTRLDISGTNAGSGEFGQATGPYGPDPSTDQVPSPSPSKQFSSKMSGDPKQLLEQTRGDVEAHADLLQIYGLTQPVSGIGISPWLRDSLAPGAGEPGNEEPYPGNNVPFSRERK